jgi:hypothetical protein
MRTGELSVSGGVSGLYGVRTFEVRVIFDLILSDAIRYRADLFGIFARPFSAGTAELSDRASPPGISLSDRNKKEK